MKISIEKDIFIKALTGVVGIISNRTTLPILSNVLLESNGNGKLVLISTDMEIGISKTIAAEIEEEGSITIPAKKILDIVRELPEKTVRLEVSKTNTIQIHSGKSFIKLIGLPKDDFPLFPNVEDGVGITLKGALLRECLRLTSFAISADENKYVLNGMLFRVRDGFLDVVATDGRRLAYIKKKVATDKGFDLSVVIPTKTIRELEKMEFTEEDDIKLINLKNQVVFRMKDGFIITRLIEGHFPEYEKVIPKGARISSKIDRRLFLSLLRRANLLTSKEAQGIKMDFLKGRILVSAKSPNLGELKEEIEATHETDGVSIGFNPIFIMDVLRNMEEECIRFDINESDKPGVVRREDQDYLCVIMPMQIS